MRTTPDVHLPLLESLVSPMQASAVTAPGPLLHGDPTPVYVLSKGQWWIAAQADASVMTGKWTGSAPEVADLNTSETWQSAQGLGLVAGRDWLSGWSFGLGIGVSKLRSRFLRREVEPGHSEMVVDTTWTGTPMGAQTNYTWDIIQTVIDEPGVERDYSATNSYTRFRVAPEVGYRIWQNGRFGLHARLAAAMLLDMGRKGQTVAWANGTDSTETTAGIARVVPLNDASMNERFPVVFALTGSLELRYRLCEHWSIGALPTMTYWLPGADGPTPGLSMTGIGGAVRLRYDFHHHERRLK